jgi:NitT/TauT family transport system ATP-binding protein
VTSSLVRLRGVSKTFASGTLALDRVELNVEDGEFLSLLGPSGCGKSTALRLIAGLIEPSGGQVAWRGSRPGSIGFVFQEPTLMPWARVWDNVYLPLRLHGLSRAAAAPQVDATLALVGLAEFARAYPRELSGGMRMRVSIARALALKPPILLMDEPFAALDEITRLKLNDDLLRLKADLGTTIVFVTHSVYESVYLSTRIAVFSMRPGRIVEAIDIGQPLPRGEEFRLSRAYADHCRATSLALKRAMGEEGRA